MFQQLIPDVYLKNVYDINIKKLHQTKNIKGIIVDLDNTLVPWGLNKIDPKILSWIKQAKQNDMRMCIVSNSRTNHVTEIGRRLDIPHYSSRFKPFKKPFLKAMKLMNTKPNETAVIGDQLFTDILGGNRLNLLTILVLPITQQDALGTRLIYRALEKLIMFFWFKNDKIRLIKNNWPS